MEAAIDAVGRIVGKQIKSAGRRNTQEAAECVTFHRP